MKYNYLNGVQKSMSKKVTAVLASLILLVTPLFNTVSALLPEQAKLAEQQKNQKKNDDKKDKDKDKKDEQKDKKEKDKEDIKNTSRIQEQSRKS